MPIRKVTDPSVLQQLNAGGPIVSNGLYPGQVESQQQTIARNAAELPYVAPKARADASKAGAEAAIAAAQAPFARDIALAGRDKAKYDAQKAQIEASGNGPKLDPSQRAKAIQQFNYAQQLNDVVDHLNQLYIKGPGATSGLEGLKDFLPTPDNTNFDTTANAARGIVGQALNFTGGQLNTPQEAAKAVGPFLPQSSDYDTTILQKINTLKEMAKNGQENAIQTLGGVPDANGNVHPITPSNALPPITGPGQDMATTATGKTRDVVDPVLKATGQRVGTMISAGAPDAQILDFLQKSGVNPADTSVSQALKFRQTPEFKRWQRANPGKSYPLGPNFYTKQVPMTDARRILNRTAASGIGGAALAAPVAAADAISGGRLDNLVADPAAAQTGMALLRGNHPISSFAGDVAGQASLEALAGTVPGAQALMATKMGRRGADLLYGVYSGSGNDEQNPGLGAVGGGVLGLGGGMLGRGLQRTIGGASRGIRNADLGYLHDAGVPLTLGRIARGAGDFNPLNPSTAGDEVGKGIAGIEDRLAGWPGLDAVIGSARQRGDQAFNQATFREIAPGVTGTGAAGLTSAKMAERAAYSKIAPARLVVDQPFHDSLDLASASADSLNHHAADVKMVIGDIRDQIANGEMTGRGYQTAMRAIRKTRSTLNDDVGGKASALLNGLEQSVVDLGEKQGGQIAADLAEANAIHGRREILKNALRGGPAQGAQEMVSAKGLNQASINNTAKFGGLDKALSPERPFYDLTSAGMKVMPNLTPDSGTAGRLLLYPLLAGAGGASLGAIAGGGEDRMGGAQTGSEVGTGLGLLTLASAVGPYSRIGQKVIQKALLGNRPRMIRTLGDYLMNANPKLASRVGASSLRDFFYQPELYSQ